MNSVHAPSDEPVQSVLLIDDSPDVHRLLRARLKQEELVLVSAAGGEEGLKVAAGRSPSLVLLDLNMPEMDGFQVLRSLKNGAATKDIPVIVLSGLQSAQDKVTAFDLGAIDYITKPFDMSELRVRVRSALRMSRLLALLAERAHVDGLTGLWNRAHFDRRWSEEVAGCERNHRPLSLALIDIDHFKSVNDTYGHPAGDAVLHGLGRILKRECRTNDIPCRYGGEEFAVIMPDTAPRDATVLCERVRSALGDAVWPRHPERRVTCSVGLAGREAGATAAAASWLEAADRALYTSKRSGRDRLTIASFDTLPLGAAA